jgi:hypothetical protein
MTLAMTSRTRTTSATGTSELGGASGEIEPLLEQLTNGGITAEALRTAILYDGADRQLPFELVRRVLADLDERHARAFLSAARSLRIWKPSEYAWILFQQARLQQSSGDWHVHAIPRVWKLWQAANPGSALRGWAACWLGEFTRVDTGMLRAAFTATPPGATRHGYYVRRLRLWRRYRLHVEGFLPQIFQTLADAWAQLGESRLADRAAVAVLLALALRSRSAAAVRSLCSEAEILGREIPEQPARDLIRAAVGMIRQESLPEEGPALSPAPAQEHLRLLLWNWRATEALEYAQTTSPPADPDGRVQWALLHARAATCVRSTSAALTVLEEVRGVLARTRPETAWCFHYVKYGLHWLRTERHLALLEIADALRCAAEAGAHELLYQTMLIRWRFAQSARLPEMTAECDQVIGALNLLRERQGQPAYDQMEYSVAKSLGVEGSAYPRTVPRLRELRNLWESTNGTRGYLTEAERDEFGALLHGCITDIEQNILPLTDDPLLVADIRAAQARLALCARREWNGNDRLYQSLIKPALDEAFSLATNLENYRLREYLTSVVRSNRFGPLRAYEIPTALADPTVFQRDELDAVRTRLRAAPTAIERRGIVRHVHRQYGEHLRHVSGRALDSSATIELLRILQDLKQPSLDDKDRLSPPGRGVLPDEECEVSDALIDDPTSSLSDEWVDAVGEHLTRERAICLDLFVGDTQIFCFVLNGDRGRLIGKLLSLDGPWPNLKWILNQWRGRLRALTQRLGSDADALQLKLASLELYRLLARFGDFFPGLLEPDLGGSRARAVYVAPALALHGLPLHALRSRRGWSLSAIAPILQISKARQLAMRPRLPRSATIEIITGPEEMFRAAGRRLAGRLGAGLPPVRTRMELVDSLRNGDTIALLGHGWFDRDRPERSRIALDNGLRLTLPDIQGLELRGAEIVLLSCWTGWGLRGNRQIGELYSGPSAWLMAGAGAVLAPLWPIPIEAGSHFIGDYLEARRRGNTRADSIAAARRLSERYEYGTICRAAYTLWGPNSR